MGILSYAQNFEDVILWRALGHIEAGTYVDVGAQHPRIDSISRAFYDKGWRGIHVEPVPAFAALLRADRPDETVLQVALAERPGTLELNVFADTGLSTAIDDYATRHQSERGYAVERITVPVMTLADVLLSLHGKAVHWLKIDVEGFEEQVLRGWDSKAVRPWVILVEATIPNSPETDFAAWDPILIEAGYRFVYFDGLNRFYVAAEHAELAAAFQAPPNVFDFAELAGLASWDLCRPVKAQLGEQLAQATAAHAEVVAAAELAAAEAAAAAAAAAERESALLAGIAERDAALLGALAARDAASLAAQAARDAAVSAGQAAREDALALVAAAADASAARIAILATDLAETRALQRVHNVDLAAARNVSMQLESQLHDERENAASWWRMADDLQGRLSALQNSRSWRLTLPLRLAVRLARRARALAGRIKRAIRPGPAAEAMAPSAAAPLMAPATVAEAVAVAVPTTRHTARPLSPRAARVYADLQQAIEKNNH